MFLTDLRMRGHEIHWPIARGMLILLHFNFDNILNDAVANLMV